jgi:L-fuconolactonase
MRIDSHQHFWRLARGDYDWLTTELAPIHRDFIPDDLAPLLDAAGVDRTVLVQAAPTAAETDFLLELARTAPFVAGVVGWTDFEAPDAADRIGELAKRPGLVGLRPMIQDLPDPEWMLRPEVTAAVRAMAAMDLRFDALVKPPHLPALLAFARRHPGLRMVVDHGGKPDIAGGAMTPGAATWPPWLASRTWPASFRDWSPRPRPILSGRTCGPMWTPCRRSLVRGD